MSDSRPTEAIPPSSPTAEGAPRADGATRPNDVGDAHAAAASNDTTMTIESGASSPRATVVERARARLAPVVARVLKLLPWFSLATGVIGAVLMDRSAKTAWLTVGAALLGWAVLFGLAELKDLDVASLDGKRRVFAQLGRVTAVIVMQSLLQQSLFFALPFYVRAATWLLSHAAFLVVLLGAAAITLWDPLFEWVVARAPLRFALQLFATFASLNAILPALGLANRASLVVSALAAAVGAPLQVALVTEGPDRRRRALVSGAVSLVALPVLVVYVLAPLIPPAPLRLTDGAVGTSVVDREIVDPTTTFASAPTSIACLTRIAAPRGVKDALVHAWWRNGVLVDRIPVPVQGGSAEGFRTFSVKHRLGKDPGGRWACVVETETGQRLGAVRFTVDAAAPAATAP